MRPEQAAPEHAAPEHAAPHPAAPTQHGGDGAQRWEVPQPQGAPPEQRTPTDQRMPAEPRTPPEQRPSTDGARPGAGTPQAQHGASDGAAPADGARERLVPADHAASYQSRWNEVKGAFVDEPRAAVAQADALVGELLDELETLFREQRRSIEQGLDTDETSTEDLRLALRRYRSFFDRLLAL